MVDKERFLKMFKSAQVIALSIMGPHAGEGESEIFTRKTNDINILGKTFWVTGSIESKPEMIRALCVYAQENSFDPECIFISPSSVGGAKQTKSETSASEWSVDRQTWHSLPVGLSPVTGRMSKNAYAFVFDKLMVQDFGTLDLCDYANFFNSDQPIKFHMGGSTVCALKKCMRSHPHRIKSNLRTIVAIGRFANPYAVWLR